MCNDGKGKILRKYKIYDKMDRGLFLSIEHPCDITSVTKITILDVTKDLA